MSPLRLVAFTGGVLILGCAAPGDTGGSAGFLGLGGDTSEGADPTKTDSDDDGLTDAEEADAGTNPDKADSDGDGWDDPEELSGNTDPTDDDDHPYQGGWPIAACRDNIEGTGTRAGDVSDPIVLTDQFGDDVSLYSFCDKEVYLVFAAFW